ncbi:MAG: hypothetical protein U0U69_11540 [Acidimicrobiia bacterium]
MNSTRGAVIIGTLEARIVSPYAAKDELKTIPGRRWDKTARQWVIPAAYAYDAEQILWRYCTHVDVRDNRPAPPPPPPPAQSDNPFTALLEAVPDGLRRKVYRSLAAVLHPDHGGNEALAKALNAAHDRVSAA